MDIEELIPELEQINQVAFRNLIIKLDDDVEKLKRGMKALRLRVKELERKRK